MVYLKVMQGDTLVTTEAHEVPVWINFQKKNNIMLRCSKPKAQGILSLNGNEIYQLSDEENLTPKPEKTAVIITFAEYEELNITVDEDLDSDVPADNPEGDDHIMTAAEMRAAISSLTEAVTDLQARNVFLEDCLLEMSEEVYA